MGNQSLLVVTGFIVLHVAMIVNFVALGSPSWLHSESNSTSNYTTQGLWSLCVTYPTADNDTTKDCDSLGKNQPVWFTGVEVLYTVGCSLVLLAVVAYYVLFVKASNYSQTARINCITLFLITAACVSLVIAIALFGKWGVSEVTELKGSKTLGWSYFTGIAGTVLSVVGSVIVCREGWMLRADSRPYQDL